MKLASLKHGRDGKLVVVSTDLAWCADAGAYRADACRPRSTIGTGCRPICAISRPTSTMT